MGSIYQLARHAIIYLGESTPDSVVLFDALASSHPPLNSHGSGFTLNISRLLKNGSEPNVPEPGFSLTKLAKIIKEARIPVESLARQWDWFTRI
jgi:hypothetical protein